MSFSLWTMACKVILSGLTEKTRFEFRTQTGRMHPQSMDDGALGLHSCRALSSPSQGDDNNRCRRSNWRIKMMMNQQ